MNKIFYDFEFLEGTQDKTLMGIKYGKTLPTIQPISIGLVSNDNREYYAIFNDFNLKEAWNRFDLDYGSGDQRNLPPKKVYWIRENVLKSIFIDLKMEINGKIVRLGLPVVLNEMQFNFKNFKYLIHKYGKSTEQIAEEIKDFCMPIQKRALDAGIDGIIGNIDKPFTLYGYYSAYDHVALSWCFGKMIDLPNGFPMYTADLKQMLDEKVIVYEDHFMNGDESFDTRMVYVKNKGHYPKQVNEHSAIHDARWNKELYEFIKTLR